MLEGTVKPKAASRLQKLRLLRPLLERVRVFWIGEESLISQGQQESNQISFLTVGEVWTDGLIVVFQLVAQIGIGDNARADAFRTGHIVYRLPGKQIRRSLDDPIVLSDSGSQ